MINPKQFLAGLFLVSVLGCDGGVALDSDLPAPQDEAPGDPDSPPDPVAPAFCEGKAKQPVDAEWTIVSGELERSFRVHVPESYDPSTPAPVVLNFHGFSSNSWQQNLLTRMNDKSDEVGFISVHPDGIGLTQGWNAGVCCGEAADQLVDDVQFVRDMLDDLSSRLCVDTARIYSTGLSNGGFLSHRLACELSDRITAIAPVAGVIGISDEECAPSRPVPVLHFHGTLDTLVPFGGSDAMDMPSVEATMAGWSERNGCSSETTETYRSGDSVCTTFDDCPGEGPVTLCVVDNGGHTWPGGVPIPGLGKTTYEISATDAMWDFFSRFALTD